VEQNTPAFKAALVEKLRIVADKEAVKGKLADLYGREQGIRQNLQPLWELHLFPML